MTQICNNGKVSYGRREANEVLKHMKRNRHVTKKPQRIYFCTDCKQWHITSKHRDKF